MTRIAVELSLLTFVHSSELRFARWAEVDFDKSLWRVPAKREEIKGVSYLYRGMKEKEEHDATKVMSENTVNSALRTMGYDTKKEVCGHGFRTMARGALCYRAMMLKNGN